MEFEYFYESKEMADKNARDFTAWVGYYCEVEFDEKRQKWKLTGRLGVKNDALADGTRSV
jgi:hypothetical protein